MSDWNDQSQDFIDDVVRRFDEQWRASGGTELSAFVPPPDQPLRRKVLLALISVDQELAYQRGRSKTVEEYLGEWPELREDAAAVAALCEAQQRLYAEPARTLAALKVTTQPHAVPLARAVAQEAGVPDSPDREADAQMATELGDYRLLEELGHGGMGTVYRALHTRLDKTVAVKVLPKGRMHDPQMVTRFHREMKAVGRVSHPNIVQAYDAREVEGTAILAMELVDGLDVKQVIEQIGPLPVADACEITRQTAVGLQCIHEHGLVHRDIKPSNLMLTREGQVKILDLGLARISQEQSAGGETTASGQAMGTADYMAPEQAVDTHSADIRADIYSLGATLYQLLTGVPPFPPPDYTTATSKLIGHARDPVKPVRQRRADIPEDLAACVELMLEKAPDSRPGIPTQVAEAMAPFARSANLRRLMAGMGTSEGRSMVAEAVVRTEEHLSSYHTDTTTSARAGAARTSAVRGRNKVLVGGALAMAAMLVLLGVIFKLRTREGVLVVEVSQPDAAVEVLDEKGKIVVNLKSEKTPLTIGVEPGKGRIRVQKDGFELFSQEFSMTSGGREAIRASLQAVEEPVGRLVKSEPAPCAAEKLKREDISEVALANVGDGDPKAVPAELMAVLGDMRFRFNSFAGLMAYSPDGKILAVPAGNNLAIFDATSGKCLRILHGHSDRVYVAAFSSDGRVLASGSSDRTVRLWEVDTGRCVQTLSGLAQCNTAAVCLSADDRWLAYAGDGNTICFWDRTTKSHGPTLRGHSAKVYGMSIGPDSRSLASFSEDGAVSVWNLAAAKRLYSFNHADRFCEEPCVRFSRDGTTIASGDQETVQLRDVASSQLIWQRPTPASFIGFDVDGQTLVTGRHHSDAKVHSVNRWEASTGKERGTLTLRSRDDCADYAISPDGRTLAAMAMADRVVQLYDARSGQTVYDDPGHTRRIRSVAFSPDGQLLASGGDDLTVRIWDLATGKQRHLLQGHKDRIWSLAFSPDGQKLASWSADGTIFLWDPVTGARKRSLVTQCRNMTLIAFSPDNRRLAAGTDEGGVQFWSAQTGEEIKMLSGLHNGLVRCVAFSEDGSRLASAGQDGKVVLTDFESGKVLTSFQRKSTATTVHFVHDQDTIVASYDFPEPVVRLWSIKDGECVTLTGHSNNVLGVALRPDGRLLATGSEDDSVRLWELGKDRLRTFVLGMGCFGGDAAQVAFSPDGRYLASANGNGTIYLFRLPPPKEDVGAWMETRGCTLPPGLAHAEWLERVKKLSVGNLVQAVSDRLRELNPGFDGVICPSVERGSVAALSLCTDQVDNIAPLQAFSDLRRLECCGSDFQRPGKLADLAPLEGLPLQWLSCCRSPVRDLTPLRNMPLKELYIIGTLVTDLSPLRKCPLEELNCWYVPRLNDLGPLKGLRLRKIITSWTGIKDLSPLEGMPLEVLAVDNTSVADLTPLRNTKLRDLTIHDTGVSELTAIKDLPLCKLECYHTQVRNLSPLSGMSLREISCDFQPDRDAKILRSIETLEKINNKSAQDFWKEQDTKSPPKKE